MALSIFGIVLLATAVLLAWQQKTQSKKLKRLVEEKTQQLTASEKTVEKIVASEERYRATIERVSDAFIALDKNWCYTYMNSKAAKIFNRDPHLIIGKHIWTEFPEVIGQPFYEAYHKAMVEQKYIFVEAYYAPYQLWFETDALNMFYGCDLEYLMLEDILVTKK